MQILLRTGRVVSSGKHAHEMYTPLTPTFYIEKLGFAGVYLIFVVNIL